MCMGGGCHPENFYKFVVHKTESRKYPFSGIGLVRENPNDTIEIFYSNATEQEGVNEVLTAKFATDTVVGMNESWVNIDFGEKFGKENIGFSPPDYSEKGGQYFKICNRGRDNLFYFVFPCPIIQTLSNFYNNQSSPTKYYYFIYSKEKKSSIYEILFTNTTYNGSSLRGVSDMYKKHDMGEDVLFYVSNYDTLKINFMEKNNSLSRTTNIYNFEDTTKIRGKAFFYGVIYPNECMINSKYTGGLMLQNVGSCYDDTGEDCLRMYE